MAPILRACQPTPASRILIGGFVPARNAHAIVRLCELYQIFVGHQTAARWLSSFTDKPLMSVAPRERSQSGATMRRTRVLQKVRKMRFEALLERHERGELSQIEAAELFGVGEQTFRRWRYR